MAVGSYSKTEKDRFAKRLKLAKKIVRDFHNIDEIVHNFDYIETSSSIDNPLVRLFASTKYDIWGKPNQELSNLKQIEEGLSLIDVFNLPKSKRSHIFSRLRSNQFEDVLSVISEIELAYYFIKKMGKENVTIEPILSNGMKPELKLNLNGIDIYIEQTTVDRGTVERKLEYIFTKACEHLWSLSDKEIYVIFSIDTSKLIWNEDGHLNVEESTQKILNSIKDLNLFIFFNICQKGHLEWLAEIASPDKYIIDRKNILHHYGDIGKFLSENIDKEPFKTFCKRTKIQDIIDSPIVSFLSSPHHQRFIEMTPNYTHPSRSSLDQEKAFLDHVIRNIKRKVNDAQRDSNKPNLLFIKAQNGTTLGYTTDEPLEFEPIQIKIEDFLNENNVEDLSAIILYEQELSKGRVIINKYAKDNSALTLGFINKWILSQA